MPGRQPCPPLPARGERVWLERLCRCVSRPPVQSRLR